MNNLSIKKIASASVIKYKEKWKVLLLISVIRAVIGISLGIGAIIINTTENFAFRAIVMSINLILIITSIYFISRLMVAMIISIKSSPIYEEVAISYSYNKAKLLTWRYIKFSILLGLMFLVPIIFLTIGFNLRGSFNENIELRIFYIVLGSSIFVYIDTIFRFSLFTSVLYPNENKIFKYSRNLVSGNFVSVAYISIISLAVPTLLKLTRSIFDMSQYGVLIQICEVIIGAIPMLFITPFIVLFNLEAMKSLESLKRIKKK